jgi:hypothetical protein
MASSTEEPLTFAAVTLTSNFSPLDKNDVYFCHCCKLVSSWFKRLFEFG